MFETNCYKMVRQQKMFSDAELACQNEGGMVAKPITKAQVHFVYLIDKSITNGQNIAKHTCACAHLHINMYTLAGATRPCPGHYIKIIKCTVRAKVARYVSPKEC